jgi:hypothetical protein
MAKPNFNIVVTEVHRFEIKSDHFLATSIDGDLKNMKVQVFEHGSDTRSGQIIIPIRELRDLANALAKFDKEPTYR